MNQPDAEGRLSGPRLLARRLAFGIVLILAVAASIAAQPTVRLRFEYMDVKYPDHPARSG